MLDPDTAAALSDRVAETGNTQLEVGSVVRSSSPCVYLIHSDATDQEPLVTLITETINNPGSVIPRSASIDVYLAGTNGALTEGFVNGVSIAGHHRIPTSTGKWTLDLTGNSAITPAGTAWRRVVTVAGATIADDFLSVPAAGGPYRVDQVLTLAPGPIAPPGAAPAAAGVPTGGTTNQVLAKNSNTDYDTHWVAQSGGVGGGQVNAVVGSTNISINSSDPANPVVSATGLATTASVTSAIATHAAAVDPHGDRAYANGLIAAADALVFKGVLDCSASPNYPAADAGWTYRVSVAGKIGGASGQVVEVGDILLCTVDGTSSGTQAGVGANWSIIQTNIDGAVIGPASSIAGHVATFSGASGKVIQDSGLTLSGVNTGDQNLSGLMPLVSSIDALSDVDTSTAAPNNGQGLVYNPTSGWVPGPHKVNDDQFTAPLSRWHTQVAGVTAFNGRAKVLFMGDSQFDGFFAHLPAVQRLSALLNPWDRTLDSSKTAAAFGTWYPGSVTWGIGAALPLWTQTGGVTSAQRQANRGLCGQAMQLTNGQTVTFAAGSCESITFSWLAGAGGSTIDLQVDGATVTTVSGATAGTYTATGLSATATHTSGFVSHGTTLVDFVQYWWGNTTYGVVPYTSAYTGQGAKDAINWSDFAYYIGLINPDLVNLQWGINDQPSDPTGVTWRANMATIIDTIRAVNADTSIVVWLPSETNGHTPWDNMRVQARRLATAKNVALADAGEVMPSMATVDTYGIGTADRVHYSTKGQQLFSSVLLDVTASGWMPTVAAGVDDGVYGDASDGNLVFDGIATVLGIVPSANTYTVGRNIYANNCTVNTGVSVFMGGNSLYVKGVLTGPGSIVGGSLLKAGGSLGVGAGGVGQTGTIDGGEGGATGVVGVGATTANRTTCLGGRGGNGGAGTSGAGGTSGTVTAPAGSIGTVRALPWAAMGILFSASTLTLTAVLGGTGGASGAGDGVNKGGGGGASGGLLIVAARNIASSNAITIDVSAGAGENRNAGNVGGGGGGGGGHGILISRDVTVPILVANGGALGTKNGTGVNGTAGAAGAWYTIRN